MSSRLQALVIVSVVSVLFGCSEQGEGERCDINNAHYDCEPGLLCKSEAELGIEGRGEALCCPPDDVPPTVDACRAGVMLPPDPPPDAGDGGS